MDKKKKDKIKSFNNSFKSLKNKILKGPKNDMIDQIDGIIDRVSDSVINKDSMNYAEMIRNVFSDSLKNEDLFKNTNSNIFLSNDLLDRLSRYINAEEVCDSIPYCARALKVIADEIVAPDHITKEILQFLTDGTQTESEKESLTNVRSINRILKIDDYIQDIVYETLKLGDQFIEICDYTSEDVPITQSLLYEGNNTDDDLYSLNNKYEITFNESVVNEFGKEILEKRTVNVIPTIIESVRKKREKKSKKNKKDHNVDISNVRLIIHDAKYVIKLQSPRFKMCLGYLVLPRASSNFSSSFKSSGGSSSCTGTSRSSLQTQLYYGKNYQDFMGMDKIYADIINVVKRHIGKMEISVNKKEVMGMIIRTISEFEREQQMHLQIRYIPPERMEHFHLSNRRFFPYGEGIFTKLMFSAKLLIAFETALVIKRISDSSEKRLIYIESGIPRNVRNLIESFKEKTKKKKFSVDTMGNIGSISCLDLKTKIKLTNGHSLTLGEIIQQFQKGMELEVYSYDQKTGKICPDKIKNAKITGYDVKVIKINLDNGKYVICTPEHLWMKRDGTYVQAIDLKPDDSLMPIYTKLTKYGNNKGIKYESIYHPGINEWELTHRSFGKYWGLVEDGDGKVLHHCNKNPCDNSSGNLMGITRHEHTLFHLDDLIDSRDIENKKKLVLTESDMCIICSKPFERKYSSHSSTCSKECFKKYRSQYSHNSWEKRKNEEQYRLIEKICSNCGKKINVTNATLRSRRGRYLCCDNLLCRRRTDSFNRMIARNPSGAISIDYKYCKICGKLFIVRSNNPKYCCSRKCVLTDLRNRRWHRKSQKIDYNCDNCGKSIIITQREKKIVQYHACKDLLCKKRIESLNSSYRRRNGRMYSDIYFDKCIICDNSTIFCKTKPGYYYFTCGSKSCSITSMQRGIYRTENVKNSILNHKVKSVEILDNRIVVGDIQTENFHNFSLDNGIFVHNSLITSYEDYYIPQSKGKRYVEFDTLQPSVNIRDLSDELKMLRDILISGLEIPPAFISHEENLSSKCLDLKTKIPLLSGCEITIQNLVDEYKSSGMIDDKYTYSYDIETGKIVPGKISWAGITRKNAQVIEVILDNGKKIICTPDHKFMVREGFYKEAQNLKSGESLMPLYTRETHFKSPITKESYQEVYHPGINTWEKIHHVVLNFAKLLKKGLVSHHKDLDLKNNNLSNLSVLTQSEHMKLHLAEGHCRTTGSGKIKKENYIEIPCEICGELFVKYIARNKIACDKPECKKEMKCRASKKVGEIRRLRSLQKNPELELTCLYCGDKFIRRQNYIDQIKSGIITCGKKECYSNSFSDFSMTKERNEFLSECGKKGGQIAKIKLIQWRKDNGFLKKGWSKKDLISKSKKINHSVVSVRFLEITIDTGDITVDKFHNFTISAGIIVQNSALSHENILFARTVVGYQTKISKFIRSLFGKIYKMVFDELLSSSINITFSPPKMLQVERESEHIETISRIISSLKELGINEDYLKKKYLSIDWEELKKYEIEADMEKQAKPEEGEEEGGYGGGF